MEVEKHYARSEFWALGVVGPWYLRPSQLDIYELIRRDRNPFIEAARRFGKTNSILAFVLEMLLQNPGWICTWCFPFKNQATDVLIPEVSKMQMDCPEENKFRYQSIGSAFVGPGDSRLKIRGVNEDKGESARGPASNIVVADEYGFWREPGYIIRSVLLPQLEGQEGRWLIKASTPPPDLGHVYYEEREVAVRKHRFIQKTIYDKETLTKSELDEIIEESGGINSPAFRRERLCEAISNPEMLVIPEYREDLCVVDDDYGRPQFCDKYVGGDSGADDNTALLFGWYDFLKDELVVEQEYVTNGRTTGEITQEAKRIELDLWGSEKPYSRVYDADKQLRFDVTVDQEYEVSAPRKQDKIAAIHELRMRIQSGKLKIKSRCTHLRRQLKVGLWRDEKHQDFQRSDSLGHLDAVAACIYLNRSIDTTHNPWPRNLGLSHDTHHIPPDTAPLGQTGDALVSAFGLRKRGTG